MKFPELQHYEVSHQFLMGYLDYYYRFKIITKRAKVRFERRDWHGTQADARTRITLYRDIVDQTTKNIVAALGDTWAAPAFWADVKQAYAEDIAHFDTRNIAETFYNSVYRHFHAVGADSELMFVSRTGDYREFKGMASISHEFKLRGQTPLSVAQQVLNTVVFDARWENKARDAERINRRWLELTADLGGITSSDTLEVLTSVFYRNKSAYVVGRYLREGRVYPYILPLLHTPERGIFVDALLLETDQVTSIFSYHRSYFLADITVPSDMVDFLQTFMPTKAISELYNAIGFEKHGKTVFYRELRRHFRRTALPIINPAPATAQKQKVAAQLKEQNGALTRVQGNTPKEQSELSPELFITAPGIPGMVMYVFTMPRLNMVFKIIRDKFAPPKQVTAAVVKEKYELVSTHDRVGRMADSYLFQKLSLPRDRFATECLTELQNTAAAKVKIDGDQVLISHVYVEKKMTPLNIFLETADEKMAQKALRDYGRAIKQLASANIFPGDLLLKNFGVTRVNRVVFYDYDEIELVTECTFRHIPEAKTYEQEMASQPWYFVGPKDIFPEEFPGFLMRSGPNLTYLRQRHGDIFDADYWNDVKTRLLAGEIMDVFPYRSNLRF
ncbi:bifunctional isocitrate dehydrogenase kinase/phosphatase [Neolewinella antarctica]|uniref:Isocitrate dehydrogenase kinase/phosphatase n=1 Tax=Neolewinella antarctica TaxID=442734 RepID=A0ABX0XBZ5_9BACT|nr:bifunctional isocitrate dehydrogenase kinase/phosphatase [Neolewinella antarctica]NJC26790.1 isocitrate dehydrogenase kinase/phosphatase [Neolewinella antarctica]